MITVVISSICLVFSFVVYLLGFFDRKGAVATFILSMSIIMLSPPWWFFTIVAGYIMIIIVTVYRTGDKERIRGTRFREDKKRTYTNVLGKVVTPVIAAIIGDVGMFISSISFGVADSSANEIGVLSRQRPILITTALSVGPGTNGAVSLLGTCAGCIASFIMGMIVSLIGFSSLFKLPILFLALVSGTVGNLIDSFMGSVLENKGFLKGWQVNFLSSLAAGVIGRFTYSFFFIFL